MDWNPTKHSANYTDGYLFSQLIPYLGNKRKLLSLIMQAINHTGVKISQSEFVDLFAGTGVVSRFAKTLGFRVISNDWEPYSEIINRCYIATEQPPIFARNTSYNQILDELNSLPPISGWVTKHLCPDDDDALDTTRDRMFYTRANGMRIDAIREHIATWDCQGALTPAQRCALLAPLMYQCSYNSNTSGVFKGFHNGWGGKTNTALYRIRGNLALRPTVFLNNGQDNLVFKRDAGELGSQLADLVRSQPIIYLDPPYNQHPYGSNYHVLNTVALWDKPTISPKISGHGDKSAIRVDWRSERRSAYNYKERAACAYQRLLSSLPEGWYLTSYSTDGMISLEGLVEANRMVGNVTVFSKAYKRYRVSSQRFSEKPLNIEFILTTEAGRRASRSTDEIVAEIYKQESDVLKAHHSSHRRETAQAQMELHYGE